jgi:hypothetical protein
MLELKPTEVLRMGSMLKGMAPIPAEIRGFVSHLQVNGAPRPTFSLLGREGSSVPLRGEALHSIFEGVSNTVTGARLVGRLKYDSELKATIFDVEHAIKLGSI